MANNVPITPGSGVNVTSEQITADSSQTELVKLAVSADGDRTKIPATAANGMTVDVTRVQGNVAVEPVSGQVFPVNDNGGTISVDDGGASLTVDAPVASPVFVRLSDGTNPITTQPVSGSVTAAQGTAASPGGAWPMKVSDGTSTAGLSTVGSDKALKVDVIQSVGGAAEQADNSTFTEGTSDVAVMAGEYISSTSAPSSGQAAAVRITQQRALHANLRKNDGTELGISTAPLRTDPTGTTPQPVTQSGSPWGANVTEINTHAITEAASGTQAVGIRDSAGASIGPSNPLVVTRKGDGETRVTNSVTLAASETAADIWTPASGKKFRIRKIVLVVTTAGPLRVFDGTDAAANCLFDSGTDVWPTGVFPIDFDEPWPSTTANNHLQYTSGSALVGVITTHGFEE